MQGKQVGRPPRGRCHAPAFTLIELLVVMGIIAILMAILLPCISAVRTHALVVKCAANIQQICACLQDYASGNRGRFPPEVQLPDPASWCDDSRGGEYFPGSNNTSQGLGGGVLMCPADEGGKRSYSANAYTGCLLDGGAAAAIPQDKRISAARCTAQVVLVTEAFSWKVGSAGNYYSSPIIGWVGPTAGAKFGAGGGIPGLSFGRFGQRRCELPFGRHARAGSGYGPQKAPPPTDTPLNFGYGDGHVDQRTVVQLADLMTGTSTLDTMWSPADVDAP